MWIQIKTATDSTILDNNEKNAVIKGLKLLILVGNEEEALAAARILHTLVPPPGESQKKHTI